MAYTSDHIYPEASLYMYLHYTGTNTSYREQTRVVLMCKRCKRSGAQPKIIYQSNLWEIRSCSLKLRSIYFKLVCKIFIQVAPVVSHQQSLDFMLYFFGIECELQLQFNQIGA